MSIESTGPVTPVFRVKFQTEMFDFQNAQGLAIAIRTPAHITGDLRRHAICVRYDSTPAQVANSLRKMADWIEEQAS